MATKKGTTLGKFLRPKTIVRLFICTAASIGLAAVILWCLLSNTEPKATLSNLYVVTTLDTIMTITFEMQFNNTNYFRGFNFSYGWIDFFYVAKDDHWEANYLYIPAEYLGFRKSMPWNDNVSTLTMPWATYTDSLKTQESYIYVSLYLSYWYKILFWSSTTINYQWLDCKAYLNNSLILIEPVNFQRTKDFSLAMST